MVSGTPILNNNIIKEANLGSIADYGNDRSVQLQHRATSFTKTKIAKLLIILIKASLWRRITNSYILFTARRGIFSWKFFIYLSFLFLVNSVIK